MQSPNTYWKLKPPQSSLHCITLHRTKSNAKLYATQGKEKAKQLNSIAMNTTAQWQCPCELKNILKTCKVPIYIETKTKIHDCHCIFTKMHFVPKVPRGCYSCPVCFLLCSVWILVLCPLSTVHNVNLCSLYIAKNFWTSGLCAIESSLVCCLCCCL